MIRHASVYDPAPPDCLRVLVMRYWPRGVRRDRVDVWLRAAAPSPDLLRAYTHAGLAWADFERGYRQEMLEQRPDVLDQLRQLEQAHGCLVLLCHERVPPQPHCHREVLAALLGAAP